jgi:hypothetical protein
VTLHLDLLHLEIGDGGEELRVPVHKALVLVDEPVAIELDEHLQDGPRQALVHGEALARPIAGGAEPGELTPDGALRIRFPGPDALQELRAAEAAAVRLLALHELALDHHLGGDAGVIGARLPEHVAAAHALEAAQDVLQGVVESVAHMQGSRHVGRRDHDAEGLGRAALRAAGPESAGLVPAGGDARLDGGGVERLVHHGAKPVPGARRADRRARKPSGPAKSTQRPEPSVSFPAGAKRTARRSNPRATLLPDPLPGPEPVIGPAEDRTRWGRGG